MKSNRFIVGFDYILFLSVIFLTIIGIMFIYSANINKSNDLKLEYLKQISFLIVSLVLFFVILFFPTRNFQNYSLGFYIICLVGLGLTLFFPEVMGQRRMNLGGVSIQFSEFMKIATISLLAYYFSQRSKDELKDIKIYLKACILGLFPVGLIMLQPDLGTSLVYFPVLIAISYVAGVSRKFLLYTLLLVLVTSSIPVLTTINHLFYNNENEILSLLVNPRYIAILFLTLILTLGISLLVYFDILKGISQKFKIFFFWYIFICSVFLIGLTLSYPVNKFLKPYQKDRLLIFFNPYVDAKGSGYHIIQSMTTIGNGGLFGKGWQKGEQAQKFFLPEQATDFIYPVIAEESGFLGSIIVLILYFLIFYRGVRIILYARDYWSVYTVTGLLTMYLFHIIQNMGMCVGIMPITGIPLPFLSYGGSFLMTCYMGIGIIMNINFSRYY
ncbi:MAG: rod shape-determining protein RodA [Spirochaetes bacterium GWD1_27_9]|nr:MAG: rod shape-determining protein RodA [Spirochaetes bacterium GWB1_27_13]OHD27258.1 MAG: rod shape-determining protein RodA [Spirochaetes bacterium GWC1_27_15]OHD31383.1 MAG: rod shape-determining protein RodA [Spirochaetes bacterium GWD1_27_9]